MSREFICYICASKDGREIFSLKNCPAYIVPLPANIAPGVAKADLPLYVCYDCGHMQVPEPDKHLQKLIYEEYYNYYVVDSSEALIDHYRIPFNSFIQQIMEGEKLKRGSLLEIGCSSGEKVPFFSTICERYTGVDPSERVKLAKQEYPEHSFIQGYFPQALPEERFDIIVSQFNLEHILDVSSFIQSIYNVSNPNGILLIQVPDCRHFLRTQQPNFLAHEHIQYFTKYTLARLLDINGFRPIAWGAEGPSLITAAVKTDLPPVKMSRADDSIEEAYAQAKLFNSDPHLPNGPVIFYGVGPQLFWLLNYYKGNKEEMVVVDDNQNYHRQGLPGYKTIIQPLSKELIKKNKVIVLSLNKIYHSKVLERIKLLNEPCTVIYLKENIWVNENI